MNANAARSLAESYLQGAFAALDERLSLSFECAVDAVQDVTDELLANVTGRCPVALAGRFERKLGGVALLLSTGDAARIAALLQGSSAEETLSEEGRHALGEICALVLSSGLASAMSTLGGEAAHLEESRLADDAAGVADDVKAFLGDTAVAADFTFTAGEDLSGHGVFLCSRSLLKSVPEEKPTGASVADAATTTLSPEEMSDILSGFGPGAGETRRAVSPPENFDRILDIRLQATARLGRVEMPISAILELGPGSIIEVGHLVDEPVELLINNKPIARGDVVVVDEKFGLRITEIISQRERIESLG